MELKINVIISLSIGKPPNIIILISPENIESSTGQQDDSSRLFFLIHEQIMNIDGQLIKPDESDEKRCNSMKHKEQLMRSGGK